MRQENKPQKNKLQEDKLQENKLQKNKLQENKMQEKMPHEIKSEETKQKILAATRKLLAGNDFKHLTIRNICEESGAAYGSFYHHFVSKENLLYIYTDQLYQEACEQNPLPDWISREDFVKSSLWYLIVYGCFCEAAGKDLVRYLYENCPQDMFQQTMEKKLIPLIREAGEKGYVNHSRDAANGKDASELLIKDMAIVCKGVVFWWCSLNSQNAEEHLYETLEHLAFHMLFSFSSEKYQNSNFPRCLVTEMEQFTGSVKIPELGLKA